jgi:hypothetical protein
VGNTQFQSVVNSLRAEGHEVFDFRSAGPGAHGFSWSEISERWRSFGPAEFVKQLRHPRAVEAFAVDMGALDAADSCVMIQPCGISASLELGYAAGRAKRLLLCYTRTTSSLK